MSFLKDFTEGFQAVLVPKLTEISARLDSIEKRQGRDFDELVRMIEAFRVEMNLKLQVASLSEQLRQSEREKAELQKALPPPTH